MTAAVELIRQAEACGATIKIDREQLILKRGKLLPAPLLDKLRAHKTEILELLRQDHKAIEVGFLPLQTGEVYERQIALNSHLFIIQNEQGKWDAWRETWSHKESAGVSKAVSSKDIACNVTFDMALVKASNYLDRLTRWKGKVSA